MRPFVNTAGAYRVDDKAGRTVARYIVDGRGAIRWSVVYGVCRYAHIRDVIEASDRGEFAVRVVL